MKTSRKALLALATIMAMVLPTLFFDVKSLAMSPDFVNGNWDGSCIEVEKVENDVTYLKLTGDNPLGLDIVINNGDNVQLDLNGHTLSNYTESVETIKINEGGKLTIIDSVGTGKVTHKSTSTFGVITNRGTLTIKSGNFEGVEYTGNATNSAGQAVTDTDVLYNLGTAVIEGGSFTSPSTKTSLIHSISEGSLYGNLTIKGGTFTSQVYNVIVYDGCTATIEGGTFNGKVIASLGSTNIKVSDSTLVNTIYDNPSAYAYWDEENYFWELSNGTLTLNGSQDISTVSNVRIYHDPSYDLTCTGQEIRPEIIVTIDGEVYTGPYDVTYRGVNNLIEPGEVTYTVTFTGGKYKGSLTNTYTIQNPSITVREGSEVQAMVVGGGNIDLNNIILVANGNMTLAQLLPNVWIEFEDVISVTHGTYIVTALKSGTSALKIGGAEVTFKVTDPSDDFEVEVPEVDLSKTPLDPAVGIASTDKAAVESTLSTSLDQLKLTNEDVGEALRQAATNGEDISVALQINDASENAISNSTIASSIDQALSENELSRDTLTFADYFDIAIDIIAGSRRIGYIDQLNRTIRLSVALPASLQKTDTTDGLVRKYYMIRVHQNSDSTYDTDILPAAVSADGKSLSFNSDKFSTYVLAYQDVEPTQEEEENNNNNNENNTENTENNNNNDNTNNESGSTNTEANTQENSESQTETSSVENETIQQVEGDVTEEVRAELRGPKTGDNITTIIITLGIAAIALVAIIVIKTKKAKSENK